MNGHDHRAELLTLCEALCRDDLTGEQQQRLQELVKDDADLRRVYVRYLHMHVCLRRALPTQSEGKIDHVPHSTFRAPRWIAAAILLAMVGLASAVYWLARPGAPDDSADYVATLTSAAGCSWDAPEPPRPGVRLRPGRLQLNAGMAEITFRSGAVVLLEAPAVLEVVDPMRGYLHSGRLVARVPPPATGFVIQTARGSVLDLGTEFGVGVDDSGDTLVQVFVGAVDADFRNPTTGVGEKQRLTAGQSVQLDVDDACPHRIDSLEQRFVRRMPPAKERGADYLVPYNRQRFDALRIMPAPRRPTIDGNLADWDLSGAFFCPCEEPFAADYHVRGAMMYDRDCVYIAAHVGDPEPMRSVIDPDSDRTVGWKGGAVQVRLSTDKKLGWPIDAAGPLGLKGRRAGLPQDNSPKLAHLTMWYYAPKQKPCLHIAYGMDFRKDVINPAGFEGAFRKDADGRGYVLEYAIPWRLLNAADDPPQAGDVLGCTWNVHWSDEEGRLWRGYLVDVLNPAEKGFTYWSAGTWGKAVYAPK